MEKSLENINERTSPENLLPIEVGYLYHKGYRGRHILAEILYLASLGYIKIKKKDLLNIKALGSIYHVTLLKDPSSLSLIDLKILKSIFGPDLILDKTVFLQGKNIIDYSLFELPARDDVVYYSSADSETIALVNNFFNRLKEKEIRDSMIEKGYIKSAYRHSVKYPFLDFLLVLIFTSFTSLGLFALVNYLADSYVLFAGFNGLDELLRNKIIVIMVLLVSIFIEFIRVSKFKLTDKGLRVRDEIINYKKYLSTGEKNKFDLHASNDKYFDNLNKDLPYALVFGLEKKLSDQFYVDTFNYTGF